MSSPFIVAGDVVANLDYVMRIDKVPSFITENKVEYVRITWTNGTETFLSPDVDFKKLVDDILSIQKERT